MLLVDVSECEGCDEGKGTTIPKLIRYGRFDVMDNLPS